MADDNKICSYFAGCERLIRECYIWNTLDQQFKEKIFDNSPVKALIDSLCLKGGSKYQTYFKKEIK